jgi:23S rRNA G2445 N2-methylase RlmL
MTSVLPFSDQLDVLVRQVPGVNALYPAGSIVHAVLTATLDAVAHRAPAAPLVHVVQQSSGVRVTAKIGIGAAESSTEVSRRVHDAIAAHLQQAGNPSIEQIAVVVASVRLSV